MSHALTLGLQLHLPLGFKRTKAQDFLLHRVLPLVRQLEAVPGMRFSLAVSGCFLDALTDIESQAILSILTGMAKEGRVEVLAMPHYAPLLPALSGDELRLQLERSRQFWSEREVALAHGAWVEPTGWRSELEPVLLEWGSRFVVIDQQAASRVGSELAAGLYPSANSILEILYCGAAGPRAVLTIRAEELIDRELSELPGFELLNAAKSGELRTRTCSELMREVLGSPEALERSQLDLAAGFGGDAAAFFPGYDRPESRRLRYRAEDLKEKQGAFAQAHADGWLSSQAQQHLAQSVEHLLRAHAADAYWEHRSGGVLVPQYRGAIYEALLRGQVDFDVARHPDVDPNNGWVELDRFKSADGLVEELILDTQLMRLYLDTARGGVITEFDYKPRKTNFLNVLGDAEEALPALRDYLVTIASGGEFIPREKHYCIKSDVKVTRHTTGLVCLRFLQQCSYRTPSGEEQVELSKEFTFKSGIGAHLSNATTGFGVEYMVEGGNPNPDAMLVVDWPFILPSGEGTASIGYPLMCVGGVSSTRFELHKESLIRGESVPGGLYGLRLIDGLRDLSLDIRVSRPLWGIKLQPLTVPRSRDGEEFRSYQGTVLSFIVPVGRLINTLSGFNVFLSIM